MFDTTRLPVQVLPAKVTAAGHFLEFFEGIRHGSFVESGANIVEGRPLDKYEESLRIAALNMIRDYFNGEIDLHTLPAPEGADALTPLPLSNSPRPLGIPEDRIPPDGIPIPQALLDAFIAEQLQAEIQKSQEQPPRDGDDPKSGVVV